MISVVSLENFKSWRKVDQMCFAPITGLFGTNSSGKTSLFQLLLMLKQTVESTDRGQVLYFGDARSPAALGTYRDIINNNNQTLSLKWRIEWELPNELIVIDPEHRSSVLFNERQMAFEAEIAENNLGRLIVRKMAYIFGDDSFGMEQKKGGKNEYDLYASSDAFEFRRAQGRPWALPSPVKFYGFSDQVKAYYQNAGFLADFELAFEQLFSKIFYLGPLRQYPQREYAWAGGVPADMGQRGENAIDALLASRERGEKISRGKGRQKFTVEQYVAYWLQILGLIHTFSIEEIAKNSNLYRVWVQKSPNAPRVLITDVGFGVSQILPVLVLCYYVPEGSTILLEHPEIHLHPSAQAGLADVFIDAVEKRKVQIVLESHSEHLLKRLQRRIAEEKISPSDSALYFCSMTRNHSRLTRLDIDLWGNIMNWPEDFFGDQFGEIAAITRAGIERRSHSSA